MSKMRLLTLSCDILKMSLALIEVQLLMWPFICLFIRKKKTLRFLKCLEMDLILSENNNKLLFPT